MNLEAVMWYHVKKLTRELSAPFLNYKVLLEFEACAV